MVAKTCTHDCGFALGIPEDDLGLLSGFTSRAFAALAHLREAWCSADYYNRTAIERGLIELMAGHSFSENPYLVACVLSARLGMQQADEICTLAGPAVAQELAGLRVKGLR